MDSSAARMPGGWAWLGGGSRGDGVWASLAMAVLAVVVAALVWWVAGILDRAGEFLWQRIAVTAALLVQGAGGSAVALRCVREARARARRERALLSIAGGDPGRGGVAFLRWLVDALATELGVEWAFVGELTGEGRSQVRTVAFFEEGRPGSNFEYRLPGSPCEQVVTRDARIFRRGVAREFPRDVMLADLGIESYIGVPLFGSAGAPLGIMVAMSRRPIRDEDFSLAVMRVLAARAGAELERQQANDRLAREETFSKGILDSVPAGLFLIDARGRFLRWNTFVSAVTGYSSEEFARMSALDLFPEEQHRAVERIFAAVLASGEGSVEAEILTKNGCHQPFLVTCRRVDYDGTPCIVGVGIDVSERRRVEQALRESEERFREMAELLPDAIFEAGLDGALRFMNRRGFELFGYTPDDIAGGLTLLDLFDAGSRPLAARHAREILCGESVGLTEHTAVRRDGTRFPALVRSARVMRQGAPAGLWGFLLDFTGIQKMAEELRRSEARYRTIFEKIQDVYFETALDGTILELSPSVSKIFGWTQAELLGRSMLDLYVNPAERDLLLRRLREKGTAFDYEIAFRDRDGAGVPCSITAELWSAGEGQPSKICGTLRNITERKRSEEALRQSEEKYRSLIETIREVIFAVDGGGVLTFVSPSVEHLLGYPAEQVIGRHFSSFIHPEDLADVERQFARLMTGEIRPSEYRVVTREGGMRWVASSSRPHVREGRIVGATGLLTDIHERRLAQEALEISERKFRSIIESIPLGMHMYRVEPDGRLVFTGANPAADAILGVDNSQFVGKTIEEAFPNLQGTDIPAQYRRVAVGGSSWQRDQVAYAEGEISGAFEVHAFATSPGQMVAAFLDVTERKRTEERIRASLREKDVLLQEIHHRVKNNLQVISSLLNLQAQGIRDREILDVLKESHNRVRSMALVHQQLYQSGDFTSIDFRGYMNMLTQALYSSYGIDPEVIRLQVDVDGVAMGIDAAVPCGLIINELVTNAFKYAFPDGRRGNLAVRIGRGGDGTVVLSVEDDGVGLPEPFDAARVRTLGLQLVTMLTEQLEGSLEVCSAGGARFTVTFRG